MPPVTTQAKYGPTTVTITQMADRPPGDKEPGQGGSFVKVESDVPVDAFDAGDVVVDTVLLKDVCPFKDVPVKCVQWSWFDPSDNNIGANAYLLDELVSLGAVQSGISISDADAKAHLLGISPLPNASLTDLINSRYGFVARGNESPPGAITVSPNLPIVVRPKVGTKDIYVAINTAGATTYTDGKVHFTFLFRNLVGGE